MILTSEELIKTTTKKIKRQEEMKKILENKQLKIDIIKYNTIINIFTIV